MGLWLIFYDVRFVFWWRVRIVGCMGRFGDIFVFLIIKIGLGKCEVYFERVKVVSFDGSFRSKGGVGKFWRVYDFVFL